MNVLGTEWMDTPAVVIDPERLQRNISWMQERANEHNIRLRPHAKTHKTVEIAQLVLQNGAVGITVSKPSETLKFLEAGFCNITLAYPVVVESKLYRLLHAVKEAKSAIFQLTVDSLQAMDVAIAVCTKLRYTLSVLIHIDVGYHRVGIEEGDETLNLMIEKIKECEFLRLEGILSHAGHSYGAQSREECQEIAETERQIMLRVKATIENLGMAVNTVSVGSTPTELARVNYDDITELRPGNYVFQDRTPVRTGVSTVQNVALTVLATVVSKNKSYFIIDSGSKVLSSDGVRGFGAFGSNCYGLAFMEKDFDKVVNEPDHNTFQIGNETIHCYEIEKVSEEHGWVKHSNYNTSPNIGDRVKILVNHACPIVNLTNEVYIRGPNPTKYSVYSRGCTQ